HSFHDATTSCVGAPAAWCGTVYSRTFGLADFAIASLAPALDITAISMLDWPLHTQTSPTRTLRRVSGWALSLPAMVISKGPPALSLSRWTRQWPFLAVAFCSWSWKWTVTSSP